MSEPTLTPAAEALIVAQDVPLWRKQLINILQIIGVILAVVGTADFVNAINALSPQAASWLTVSGSALRFGIEPLVKLIGDWVDDGKRNDSFVIE